VTAIHAAGKRELLEDLTYGAAAREQVFLGDLFPGIIGFGRVHCVRYSLR
jgi:hypothetical protein